MIALKAIGAILFVVFVVGLFGGLAVFVVIGPFYGLWAPLISTGLVALLWFAIWGFVSICDHL